MANRIQLRRGTAAQWTASNPVLAQGEPGIETDTGKQKFGDGVTAWNFLPYASKGDTGAQGPAGVADDASMAAQVTNVSSTTRAALNSTYASKSVETSKLDVSAADATILAKIKTTFDPKNAFTGVPVYAYGNSWVRWANGATGGTFPQRLTSPLGVTPVNLWANGGYRMQDTVMSAFSSSITGLPEGEVARPWTAGTRGVVVVGDLLNNLIEADNQQNRDTALEACRALVALLAASARVEETSVDWIYSTSPAWTTATAADMSGGSVALAAGTFSAGLERQYVDIPVPSGVNYLSFMATTSDVGVGWVIRDGATELGTVTAANKTLAGKLVSSRSHIVWRVPGTAARTLRVTMKNITAGTVATQGRLDCMLPQSATPPLIILVKPVQTLAETHNKPALLTYLRTIPDIVKAEFGNHVVVVDPAPGWNTATMLNADLLHPNDLGQQHVADAIADGIRTELFKRVARSAFGTLV